MPQANLPARIIIETNSDAPKPTAENLISLMTHRNFEVTYNYIDSDGIPIITIREVAKAP